MLTIQKHCVVNKKIVWDLYNFARLNVNHSKKKKKNKQNVRQGNH